MDKLEMSDQVPGHVVSQSIIVPGGNMAWEVSRGRVMRVIDIEGQQVGDLVCFNLHRLDEKLSPPYTIMGNLTLRPTVGHTLLSDENNPLMTIVADTLGSHDLLAGACSRYTNKTRYDKDGTPNCRDNLAAALRPWGIDWKDIPYNINLFMNVPIGADFSVSIQAPLSRAGDHIDLRADMDVLVGLSNCPQIFNPCNNFRLKPLKVTIYEPAP